MVYRQFRATGMPRSPSVEALRAWGWLVVAAPRAARDRELRGRWVRIAAKSAGRVVGSLRQRSLFL
jgi:hypothetical protein